MRRTEPLPALELVEAVVGQEFPELPGYRRPPLAGYLLGRLTILKTNEIAELLHRGPTAVTMVRQRLEKRLAQDEQWALRVKEAELKLRTLLDHDGNRGAESPRWYRLALGGVSTEE